MGEKIILATQRGMKSAQKEHEREINEAAYYDSQNNGVYSPAQHYLRAQNQLFPSGFKPHAIITTRDLEQARKSGSTTVMWDQDTQTVTAEVETEKV